MQDNGYGLQDIPRRTIGTNLSCSDFYLRFGRTCAFGLLLNADVQPYEYCRGFQRLACIIVALKDVDQ